MKLSKGSRPSPALVLAALALVFAMVGTAIAGPDAISNKITKPKVKKIAKKQANKILDQRESSLDVNSARRADRAENADNADQLDGLDSTAFATRLWAVVDTAGTLIRGTDGVTVSDAGSGKEVDFGRNVSQCAASATLNTDDPNANPPAGEIGTAPRMGNPEAIFVQARTSAGAVTDAGFVAVVDC
jgi:hypothetical protein